MNIFLWKKFIFTLIMIGSIIFGGCSPNIYKQAHLCANGITVQGTCEPPADQPDNANGQPTVSPTRPQAEPQPVYTTSESRIYLDASESMGGFVVPNENNQFIKLLGTIGYAMPGCSLFKYGTPPKKGLTANKLTIGNIEDNINAIRFNKDFENEGFYNLENNPDDILFNYLANEEKPARSVLITDGVYSSPGTELQSETVKAIGNWMKRGRFFGILIFHGAFKGKLWTENKRSWIKNVNVERRPFYAFVFSPDEKGFTELRDKLAVEFPDIDALTFPKEAVHCDLNPKTKTSLEQSEEPPDSPFYLYQYTSEIFNKDNSAELFYNLNCTPARAYPIDKFNVEITLDHYSWKNDAFKKNEKPALYRIEYPLQIEGAEKSGSPSPLAEASSPTGPPVEDKGNLKISFNKDSADLYSFYHLIFNLSGNNNVLTKIRDLSTQDDSVPENAGKTYRFYEFISALSIVHLQNKESIKLPPPTFVVLTN